VSDRRIETAVQRLIDQSEISDCIVRAARGMDRHDAELAKSSFHPDSRDDHGSFIGSGHDSVDWATRLHDASLRSHQHYLSNILIEIDGDEAHAETYVVVVGVKLESWETVMGGGRYIDRLERRDGQWRIVERVTTTEWWSESATMEFFAPLVHPYSQTKADPSYARPLIVERAPRDVSDPAKVW
jgi:hypothetical protein